MLVILRVGNNIIHCQGVTTDMMSRVRGSVTNNNGFQNGWLYLLTRPLQTLLIKWLPKASSSLTRVWLSSLLVCLLLWLTWFWFTNHSLLLRMTYESLRANDEWRINPFWMSYVTTNGQSASLSRNKAPIWGLRPDFYYFPTVKGLLMWGAVSDEKTDPSFAISTGPRQRSRSRVRVPLDSRPYFTVSDWRLPFSSRPMTRRVTVEVFDPASTWDSLSSESALLCTVAFIV
jgi:hypothetical protein